MSQPILKEMANEVRKMSLFEEMVLAAISAGDYNAASALIAAKRKVGSAHNCNYGRSTLGYFAHCMTDDCDFDSDGIPTLSDAKDIAERHDAREI